MKQNQSYEVLGIGAPYLDHIMRVDHDFVSNMSGMPHGMRKIDYDAFQQLIQMPGASRKQALGGSACNTIRGLAQLGTKCGLVGSIGKDVFGQYCLEHLKMLEITPHLIRTDVPTSQVICFVTPDGERTLRSFLGASQKIEPEHLKPEFFSCVRVVHIEGYQLYNLPVLERAVELAKKAGAKVSLDLASFEIVQHFHKEIATLIKAHIDLIFANEKEILALYSVGPEEGCRLLSDFVETSVITTGEKGCWVGNQGKPHHYLAYPEKAVDTTGAGDLFASGFLHGYLRGKEMSTCAHYGALAAAAVVKVEGANLSIETWREIQSRMDKS